MVSHLAWFNKLILINKTDLGMAFEKIIIDGLN